MIADSPHIEDRYSEDRKERDYIKRRGGRIPLSGKSPLFYPYAVYRISISYFDWNMSKSMPADWQIGEAERRMKRERKSKYRLAGEKGVAGEYHRSRKSLPETGY